MIITLTANPSIDRAVAVVTPLRRGGVNRLGPAEDSLGGKGINVARVLAAARPEYSPPSVLAVVPANPEDPFVAMMRGLGVKSKVVAVDKPVRVNLTVTEPDGTTTKLNAAGSELPEGALDSLEAALVEAIEEHSGVSWVVLGGSLPLGTPADYYLRLLERVKGLGVRVALDTSDRPLEAFGEFLASDPERARRIAPDLIKPNGVELGQLAGCDGMALERSAEEGDFAPVVAAALRICAAGVGAVLVTLGGAGAVLVTESKAWVARAPHITVRSTVGAGDSALAGYLLAENLGLDPAKRLHWAVAHGSIAATLPGTGLPLGIEVPGFGGLGLGGPASGELGLDGPASGPKLTGISVTEYLTT